MGERTANSDVDVLIIGSVGLAELALPSRELERSLQIPIKVSHFTRAEFQDKWWQQNRFLKTVLHGKKIYSKGSDDELADTLDKTEAHKELEGQRMYGCSVVSPGTAL